MYKDVGELARIMNITATKANQLLEEAGLQFKRKEEHWTKWRWELTEEGKLYGKKISNHPFPKIFWKVPDTFLRLTPPKAEDLD